MSATRITLFHKPSCRFLQPNGTILDCNCDPVVVGDSPYTIVLENLDTETTHSFHPKLPGSYYIENLREQEAREPGSILAHNDKLKRNALTRLEKKVPR